MREKIYLEEEFRKFCRRNKIKTNKNISDYINYVKNSNDILYNKLFNEIKDICTNNDIEKLDSLSIKGNEIIISSNRNSKQKYNSGFNKYIDFIREKITNYFAYETDESLSNQEIDYDQSDEISVEPSLENDFPNINSNHKFSYSEIKEIFFKRLISQNRFNRCGVYYPISFLKQYFYKTENKKYFDDIINNQIKNIIYKTNENGTEFEKINDLKDLIIDENGIVYINNKKIFSNDFKENKYTPMNANSLTEIVIDHTEPMNLILKKIKKDPKDFPELLKISQMLKKGLNKPITYKKLIARGTKYFDDINFRREINEEQLKNEFTLITGKMDLQLMHKKHNNFKRAKV